jgi:hypothetical protein
VRAGNGASVTFRRIIGPIGFVGGPVLLIGVGMTAVAVDRVTRSINNVLLGHSLGKGVIIIGGDRNLVANNV